MSDRAAAAPPLIVIAVADPTGSDDPALAARKNELYAAGIARHGGTPALLHVGTPPQERDRLLAAMDGLLLAGGADVDPALYGEAVNGTAEIDPARDELELSAWREAARRSLPVFGICRGFQAINVFSGGKLLQDVPSHAGTPYGKGPAHLHTLEIDPASRLGRAVAGAAPDGVAGGDPWDQALELEVNTFHHQAIGRLVEGFESHEGRWVLGLQCHPERTESTPEELDVVWTDFILAASAARTRRATPIR
jgi:gamma-glutamyl-gamma-aminobutyrate hydrolase PuuD